jgi:hypothetical protein
MHPSEDFVNRFTLEEIPAAKEFMVRWARESGDDELAADLERRFDRRAEILRQPPSGGAA